MLRKTGKLKTDNKYYISFLERTENSNQPVQTVQIFRIIVHILTMVVWFGMFFFLLGALT